MYKYIHTCVYIRIYMSAHIHTYTYIHTITGPASLAEQISPEHGCSLLLLVPLLQFDTRGKLPLRPRPAAPL